MGEGGIAHSTFSVVASAASLELLISKWVSECDEQKLSFTKR